MRICVEEWPPTLGTHLTECWLLDRPAGEAGEPLSDREVALADEA
jgi:hypothetical protein